MGSISRVSLRALLLCSLVLAFLDCASVQAQNRKGISPESFPIGLVLEYVSTDNYFLASNQYTSHVRYEVVGWVRAQEIVEIEYSGGWSGNGTRYVKLPEWSDVYLNGTPTGWFMDPLWMNTTSFGGFQLTIPLGSSQSRTYNLTMETRSVPNGTFNCWRCRTSWNDQGTDVYKHLYYEDDLGVLVEKWEAGFPPIEPPYYGLGGYSFTDQLAVSNIRSFIPPSNGFLGLSSSAIGQILWLLMSLAVIGASIVMVVQWKSKQSGLVL